MFLPFLLKCKNCMILTLLLYRRDVKSKIRFWYRNCKTAGFRCPYLPGTSRIEKRHCFSAVFRQADPDEFQESFCGGGRLGMISKPDLDRLRRIKGKAGDGRIAEVGANLVLDVVFVALLSGGIEGGCGRNSGNTALLGIGLLWISAPYTRCGTGARRRLCRVVASEK